MFKKAGSYFFAVFAFSFFNVAYASSEILEVVSQPTIQALNAEQGNEIYPSSTEPEPVSVVGQARFEPRYTRVISDQCGSLPCHQSKVYWTLVVESSGVKYLWNRKVGEGVTRAPEAIEIAGMRIHPGAAIQIEAKMVKLAPDLFVLVDIDQIKPLRTLGWSCRHRVKESGPQIFARVWFQALGSPDGGYKMKVQRKQDLEVYPVAFVDRAHVSGQSNELVYGGVSSNQKIELHIQREDDNTTDLNSVLKISDSGQNNAVDHSAVDSVFEMKCSQTRLLSADLE